MLDTFADFVDSEDIAKLYLQTDCQCPGHWKPSFLALSVQAGLVLYTAHLLDRRSLASVHGRPLLHYAIHPQSPRYERKPTDPFVHEPAMVELLVQKGFSLEEEFEERTVFATAFNDILNNRTWFDAEITMLDTLLSLGASPDVLSGSGYAIEAAITHENHISRKNRLVKLFLKYDARLDLLQEEGWKSWEKTYPPMSHFAKFRNGSLKAEDVSFFASHFKVFEIGSSLDDWEREEVEKNLLDQYPHGELSLQRRDV